MNWLAHLYLSEPTDAFRIGNLLPDMVTRDIIEQLPDDYRRGAACHRQIDAYTDSHPVVRQSVNRFQPPLRRYGAVFVDIFYDHFLAINWSRYAPGVALGDFANYFYTITETRRSEIPDAVHARLKRINQRDWINSYTTVSGIRAALRGMSTRQRRPFDLAAGADVLEQHYTGFHEDFEAFFPELMAHVGVVSPDLS